MDPEDFTEEEHAALASLESDNTPPPEENDVDEKAGEPAAPSGEPGTPEPPAPTPPGEQSDDDRFNAFREQHKDKSSDELLKLFFQQDRRASRMAYDARKAEEERATFVARAAEVLAARKADIAARRAAFDQQLQDDPDAATRALAEQQFTAEEQQAQAEAEAAERDLRLDQAFQLASSAIPDLPERVRDIYAFGGEMNFTPDELNSIDDGRQLVTLYLASLTGNLIRAGMMDIRGNLVQPPPAVQATDPRLTTPAAPRTLNGTPPRPTDAAKSPEQTMADLLNMNEADFAKLSTEDLMRLTGG